MSQIETIMLIILGFAVALLVAMILGKLLWGQAIGLGKRRSRREDPVTIAALQADKDKLRAEAAMLSRKLELRLNDLKTRLAEQSAEVSRNRNRVDRLAGEIKDRDKTLVDRQQDIDNLKSQMVPLEQELVTRTQISQQLKEQLRERDESVQSKTSLIDDLQEQLRTALSVNTANAIVGSADLSAKERLQSRISDLTQLSKQIENQRIELSTQHTELKTLTADTSTNKNPSTSKPVKNKTVGNGSSQIEKQLEEAERETDQLQRELAQLDQDWNEKLKQLDDVKPAVGKTKKPGNGKIAKAQKKPAKKRSKKPKQNPSKTPPETSNVVSLASRIRSLQNDIKDQK